MRLKVHLHDGGVNVYIISTLRRLFVCFVFLMRAVLGVAHQRRLHCEFRSGISRRTTEQLFHVLQRRLVSSVTPVVSF